MPSENVTWENIFVCRQCGECCRGYGGTFLAAEDIDRISAYIGVNSQSFVGTYCQMSGSRPVLAQGEDQFCVFFSRGRCGIHPVKPKMCRSWPFIPSVLVDVQNWHIMAANCPGMRTDVPDELITACVREALKTACSRSE